MPSSNQTEYFHATRRLMLVVLLSGVMLFVLAACGGVNEYGGRTFYVVSSENGEPPAADDMAVLLHRFRRLRNQWFANIQISDRDNRPGILVENEHFQDGEKQCISGMRGKLNIYAEVPENSWLDDTSIDDAGVMEMDGQFFLAFTLDAPGEAKMRRLSRENIGRQLAVSLDGQVVQKAVIQDELGKRFRLTMNSEDEARCMAAVLASGPLTQSYQLLQAGPQ